MKGGKRRNVAGGQTRGESKKRAGKEAVRRNLKWLAPACKWEGRIKPGKSSTSGGSDRKHLKGEASSLPYALSSFLITEKPINLLEKSF